MYFASDRDGRIHQPAGDVGGDADHDREHEPVGQRDARQIELPVRREDARGAADEDQRERGDELRDHPLGGFVHVCLPSHTAQRERRR